MAKIGRNAPCPCGSGQKYKRCCGREALVLRGYSAAERESALLKLQRFTEDPDREEILDDADELFWRPLEGVEFGPDNKDVEAMSDFASDFYAWFDFRLEPGYTVADALLASGERFSPGERRYIETMRATAMRLYEVVEVWPGQAIALRDMISGQEVRVRERLGSRRLPRWTVLAARVSPCGASGQPEIDGGMLSIPPMRHQSLRAWVREELDRMRELEPDAPERDLWGELAPDLHAAWRAPALPSRMVNYDGHEMVLTKVQFDVVERERVVSALDGARGLEREEHDDHVEWAWSGTAKERKEPVVFGWFVLRGAKLELRTNSVERGERGRKLVERLAGDAVHYRLTVTEDAIKALEEARERGMSRSGKLESPNDPALQSVLLGVAEQHMADHYERWIDEPVPMLDDHTPRDAAGEAKLRPVLVTTLKDMERMYEQALLAGSAAYDPTWMWEELGLEAERDAARGPAARPRPAHMALAESMPRVEEVARTIADEERVGAAIDHTITRASLEGRLSLHALVREHAEQGEQIDEGGLRRTELESWVEVLSNFELHRRKVFWVDEALSWMLGATGLDITGEGLRLPFAAFALVFTDRHALGLAERMLSRDPESRLRGRMLHAVTVYLLGASEDDGARVVRMAIVCDAADGRPPELVSHELRVEAESRLSRILGEGEASEDALLEPTSVGSPRLRLVHLVVNAILYATSAEPESEAPSTEPAGPAHQPRRVTCPSDSVFFLPGKIDISSLRNLKRVRRGGGKLEVMRRCMVRGHWRRAPAGWKDQRPRWIKPHWRGPSAAAIIEREYRLKP
ncbi:MAG: SEC-C domain-containing protein [Myxococcales bacterium]|nr:SEC-C domain-containing protein [Myxococcales bacterium]